MRPTVYSFIQKDVFNTYVISTLQFSSFNSAHVILVNYKAKISKEYLYVINK